MILRYFYDDHLAQASYLLGCAKTGEALVVDPNRDIDHYLTAAEREGLTITQIVETHIHADFVSGGRELAQRTGATLYISGTGEGVAAYDFIQEPQVITVVDQDQWMLGNIRLTIIHTPGHTPEHISIMVTDTAATDKPIGVFTGDFLFVGDVGRPDLLEKAAGIKGSKEVGAHQQWESVQRFKALPDYLQIWPGHGAGSACGKALGAVPSTTLGYEKQVNPAFQYYQEESFVTWLLSDQPAPPRYFAQMKKVNKAGPSLQADLAKPRRVPLATLEALSQQDSLLVDFRLLEDFTRGHVSGAISIPSQITGFLSYVGWFVQYNQPFYFVVSNEEQASEVIPLLRTIGVDSIAGYAVMSVVDNDHVEGLPSITATELANRLSQNHLTILDVRDLAEFKQMHLPQAINIPVGLLPDHVHTLPKDTTIVTQCTSGYRSQIAASWLRRQGFRQVINLQDGLETSMPLLLAEPTLN